MRDKSLKIRRLMLSEPIDEVVLLTHVSELLVNVVCAALN